MLNRPVSAELGEQIAGQFVEVLFAPGYEDGALDVLRSEGDDEDPRLDRAAAGAER